MTESELLQISLDAASTLLSIFSLFFGFVSAYVVALYLFLYRAPLALRLLAFLLVTLGFIFIAAMGWNLQYLGEGIHRAWAALGTKTTAMETLGPPLIVRTVFVDGQIATAWLSWFMGAIVYALLWYLTFIYRWTHRAAA